MYANVDDAVRDCYAEQTRSVDEILCDPEVAAEFADHISVRCAANLTRKEILKRLITLRKRGQVHGGLPPCRPK